MSNDDDDVDLDVDESADDRMRILLAQRHNHNARSFSCIIACHKRYKIEETRDTLGTERVDLSSLAREVWYNTLDFG